MEDGMIYHRKCFRENGKFGLDCLLLYVLNSQNPGYKEWVALSMGNCPSMNLISWKVPGLRDYQIQHVKLQPFSYITMLKLQHILCTKNTIKSHLKIETFAIFSNESPHSSLSSKGAGINYGRGGLPKRATF